MQQNFETAVFLAGNEEVLRDMPGVPALPAFSGRATAFFCALSRRLLGDPRTRAYPDMTDYAYWIRRASLEKMRADRPWACRKLGRGAALHIAPSNVPAAFAMSFTASVLAGNASIVRVSDKAHAQAALFADAANGLLAGEFRDMAPYVCLIRYPHDEKMTRELSALCDVRVIWGGDETIRAIRAAPLPPRAVELAFADRYSAAIVDADAYLLEDPVSAAERFYLDTYYADQNACSSPGLVFWLGREVEKAQDRFWGALADKVRREYGLQPIQAVDKFAAFCRRAADGGAFLEGRGNEVVRVRLTALSASVMEGKAAGGYFLEYRARALPELLPLLAKPCQTLSCLGVDPREVRRLVMENGARGGDRVVPMGQAMKMSLMWDGFDLTEAMSRYVTLGTEE